MDKIRAFYEYTEKVKIYGGQEKETLIVEEVFILKFLDGKNALVARKGGVYAPAPLAKDGLEIVGKDYRTAGIITNVEVMPIDKLIVVDEKTLPGGIVWEQKAKMPVF